MNITRMTMILAVVALLTVPAWGDWDLGDGHKMHYPQLPDPFGWDVDATIGWIADDWQCSDSGPVSDIHFWTSWEGDAGAGQLSLVWVQVFDNVPDPDGEGPGYSQPGEELLFDRIFQPSEFTIRQPPLTGDQGWFRPYPPAAFARVSDHDLYYQVNITDIFDPFVQEKDEIYWLAIHLVPEVSDTFAGWKTSANHFEDDAVFLDESGASAVWRELRDPINTQLSLDMAFVITIPEPPITGLLVMGFVGVLVSRRRSH